jgi:hypothetical protein
MPIRTIRRSLWFGVLFLLLPIIASASAPRGAAASELIVSVYNDAGVPVDVLVSAETIASRIFREAGLHVNWLQCSGSGEQVSVASCVEVVVPMHLHVRIRPRSRNLASSILGVSYQSEDGSGCYSDIFLTPIIHLHDISGREVGALLGHVMAHELAHLLLGTNSHSATGIMRAQWHEEDLCSAGKGELLFTEQQSQVMRRRLSSVAPLTVGD